MNKYSRALIDLPTALLKIISLKVVHKNHFKSNKLQFTSPFSEITMDKGAKLEIGNKFRQRSHSRLRVRKNANLKIGNNISLNHGCMIVCRDNISIADGVQFGPNVLLYDHDHDYKTDGGINAGLFKTAPIEIGENVWIGAGSIILKGTKIGANSVVAAGSTIKGEFPENSLIYQPKSITTKVFVTNES
ncbi:acyltransferase [Streptococcus parauberis]|uniref:acyltransferase n=1 Tax=Streptococcus parauberis TaxID=1348 RepID=UPI0037ACB11C